MVKYSSVIIGCGKIAGLYDNAEESFVYSHAKAYNSNMDIEVVCYCDIDITNAHQLAAKYNSSSVATDFIEAIDKHKPDVVSVCTPDHTHFDVVIKILKADFVPKIIFLEKPACQDKAQLDELISVSNNRNVKIVVNHSRRFDEVHKVLKNKIEKDEFGRLVRADAVYYSGWQHNGVHTVDTLNFLFSDEIEFKQVLECSNSPYPGDFNIDFKGRFKTSNALVYITTMDEHNYQLFEFDFKFEKARVRLEDFGQRVVYEKKTINEMNENVLIPESFEKSKSTKSPMQTAIDDIVGDLQEKKSLDGCLINDISSTMYTIWEGMKWVK